MEDKSFFLRRKCVLREKPGVTLWLNFKSKKPLSTIIHYAERTNYFDTSLF